jgi:hypothetical protein
MGLPIRSQCRTDCALFGLALLVRAKAGFRQRLELAVMQIYA